MSDSTRSKILLVSAVSAAAILLAVPVVLSTNLAWAAANKSIQGQGSGEVTCLNGPLPVAKTATINFQAFKSKGILQGSLSIAGTGFKFGNINGGSVGQNSFTLTGTETNDTLCLAPTPTQFTLQGECGTGVTVTFETATQRGEFTANVVCS